jgi:hypothetical protein|mmetsp:Transcript_1649/g.2639  ORF Transcript_1649/g.2639 Transcript_1649/m.2639 type:complete len:350 (+) Transcript_1649:130-1179(+)|eukprot:CAMPEP_0195282796 /NCGR_PEP_ID=MMETSP0707-20130614/1553_1 /TAXON_ID=33640 /ORGANISM="Asterionellopsis glacialis, Strain CCMP134" /LENGTH=349 /DNA_ID=CAMNT_0040341841 /DNA_START=24 /DNA_END=1070 /DNA_ORIENTATION=-
MIVNSKAAALLFVLAGAGSVTSFTSSPTFSKSVATSRQSCHGLMMSETSVEEATSTSVDAKPSVEDLNNSLVMPMTFDDMVNQASAAMKDAYAAGMKRQTLRVLLPRAPDNGDLGMYFESDANIDSRDLVLAPSDETWQGGIMQLYRAAAPTAGAILKKFAPTEGNLPPRLVEDRSVDDSGVDGIGLWMSQNTSPADDVSCFVQPSQETVDAVETISKQAGDRLVMLLNPQWRNVDDALDTASKQSGVFGSFASFLGGKGNSLRRLEEMGFDNVYTIEGYVCKGGNIRLLKRFGSDWIVFAENDSLTDYIKVGTSKTRPTYQEVDKILDDKGISLKYARDIGLAPKFDE